MHIPGRPAGAALAAALALVLLAGCRSSNGGGAAPATSAASTATSTSATGSTSSATSPPITAPPSASPVRQVTRIVHFRAFTAAGSPATAVRDAGTGQCFTTSITVPLAHVYRCFGHAEILDPCFANPTQTDPRSVLCYLDPWSSARRLTVTTALPRPTPLPNPRPWALQLANGARCVTVTGTVPINGTVALTYSCSDGSAAGLDAGRGPLFTAEYGRAPHGTLSRVAVTTMWTG